MMLRRHRDQRGVTLVELMVVVATIAIIAAIAITLYQDVQKKAKLASDQGTAAAARSAVAIYYGKHNGNFPTTGVMLTLIAPPNPTFQCSGGALTTSANNGLVTYLPNNINSC